VKVLESETLSEPIKQEVKKLGEAKLKEGYRLGCQTTFTGSITFEHTV
jgi:ferredoxin